MITLKDIVEPNTTPEMDKIINKAILESEKDMKIVFSKYKEIVKQELEKPLEGDFTEEDYAIAEGLLKDLDYSPIIFLRKRLRRRVNMKRKNIKRVTGRSMANFYPPLL